MNQTGRRFTVNDLRGAVALLLAMASEAAAQQPRAEPDAVVQRKPWRTRWAVEAEVGGKKHLYLFDAGAGITLGLPTNAKRAG